MSTKHEHEHSQLTAALQCRIPEWHCT